MGKRPLRCQIYSVKDDDADDFEEATGLDYYEALEAAEALFKDAHINLMRDEAIYKVCLNGDQVEGAITLRCYGLGEMGLPKYSFSVAVHETARRQGVARALITEVLQEFPSEEAELEAWVVNPDMVTLLEEMGFEPVDAEWSLTSPFMFRPNPDDTLRDLERNYEADSSDANRNALNAARLRAGITDLIPKVFKYGEGWQAQTTLPDGLVISSATESHDGWWGIGHMSWISGKENSYRGLGDHFIRWWSGSLAQLFLDPTQPKAAPIEKQQVLRAHQIVITHVLQHGIDSVHQFHRWPDLPGVLRRNPHCWHENLKLNYDERRGGSYYTCAKCGASFRCGGIK